MEQYKSSIEQKTTRLEFIDLYNQADIAIKKLTDFYLNHNDLEATPRIREFYNILGDSMDVILNSNDENFEEKQKELKKMVKDIESILSFHQKSGVKIVGPERFKNTNE